ncbi:hypothetical protein [Halorubrum sp. BV1]|uniref:hypothetical protein n=1 Tax=Halorubrum sp. BV1 TaxID=1498500 RepID=UPI0006787307|nr:hypothetical protein [Halorubrum sp. BV1]
MTRPLLDELGGLFVAGGELVPVDDIEDGSVDLTDDDYDYVRDGPADEDDGPASTSHVGF